MDDTFVVNSIAHFNSYFYFHFNFHFYFPYFSRGQNLRLRVAEVMMSCFCTPLGTRLWYS